MRWKLIFLIAILAALLSSAVLLLVLSFVSASTLVSSNRALMRMLVFVASALPVVGASYFMYRHSARKRKTQAGIAALFSLALTAIALAVAHFFF